MTWMLQVVEAPLAVIGLALVLDVAAKVLTGRRRRARGAKSS